MKLKKDDEFRRDVESKISYKKSLLTNKISPDDFVKETSMGEEFGRKIGKDLYKRIKLQENQ